MSRPTDTNLTAFFEDANYNNALARQHCPQYATLVSIDTEFRKIQKIVFAQPLLPVLWGRSHCAYRTACYLVCSGVVAETYSIARFCIENALYGKYIAIKPDAGELWLNRDKDEQSRREFKKQFKFPVFKSTIEASDPDLWSKTMTLYEWCIDQGAHPNVAGLMSGAVLDESKGQIATMELHPGTTEWKVCFQSVRDAGELSLQILQSIDPEKYDGEK